MHLRIRFSIFLFLIGFFVSGQEVRQITNLPKGSDIGSGPIFYKNKFYFAGVIPGFGIQLYSIDTEGKNLSPITNFNAADRLGIVGDLIILNDRFYFSVRNNAGLCKVWVSDGSASGTIEFDNFPIDFASFQHRNYIVSNQKLYFFYGDFIHQPKLYVTDGTAGGTTFIKQFSAQPNGVSATFVVFNNNIYLNASDGIHGSEPWVIDQSNNVSLLKDINSGPNSSWPGGFKVKNGKLFFYACANCVDNNAGGIESVWVTDGTPGGTHGFYNNQPVYYFEDNQFGEFSNYIYYDDQNSNVCFIDGISTTELVIPNCKCSSQGFQFNGELIFSCSDLIHGSEPWVTDGTIDGSHLLNDIYTGINGSNPAYYFTVNNNLFFLAHDGPNIDELWETTSNFNVFKKVFTFAKWNWFHGIFLNQNNNAYFTDIIDNTVQFFCIGGD